MAVIWYCESCGGLTFVRRKKVAYEYEIVLSGKTSQEVLDVNGKSTPQLFTKRTKKVDIGFEPNRSDITLTKEGKPYCNDFFKFKSSRTARCRESKQLIEVHVADEIVNKHIADYLERIRGGNRIGKYSQITNAHDWLQQALTDGYILTESLAFVTTLLL